MDSVTARVWTLAELETIWRLPVDDPNDFDDDGTPFNPKWRWEYLSSEECWAAVNGNGCRVYVDSIGRLQCSDIDGEDYRVSLAVIGAHQGRD